MPAKAVIDLRHWLNDKGAIAAQQSTAKRLAEFAAAVVAHGKQRRQWRRPARPGVFQCRRRDAVPVHTDTIPDDVIRCQCIACGTKGQIHPGRTPLGISATPRLKAEP